MRGSSGATVTELTMALKQGGRRVVEQGRWLQHHPYVMLPHVYEVDDVGYRMEWLTDPPYEMLDHSVLLDRTYDALHELWLRPPAKKFVRDAHQSKIDGLVTVKNTAVIRQLNQLRDRTKWNLLESGLTHGDPTLDNVMLRDSQIVLIDPIPATHAVPDLRSVDTGKLLQSILGYELLRYADTTYDWRLRPENLRHFVVNDNEWLATVYWCVVHLLRAIPYMPNEDVVAGVWGMVKNAFDLV